jgi:hypothetical protein
MSDLENLDDLSPSEIQKLIEEANSRCSRSNRRKYYAPDGKCAWKTLRSRINFLQRTTRNNQHQKKPVQP